MLHYVHAMGVKLRKTFAVLIFISGTLIVFITNLAFLVLYDITLPYPFSAFLNSEMEIVYRLGWIQWIGGAIWMGVLAYQSK